MSTRNALLAQRPRIMIHSFGWCMRNRLIAAPNQMDRLPISWGWNPKVVRPPKRWQVCHRRDFVKALVMTVFCVCVWRVQRGVSGDQPGTVETTRVAARLRRRRTGVSYVFHKVCLTELSQPLSRGRRRHS
jgi:hypothetical protein